MCVFYLIHHRDMKIRLLKLHCFWETFTETVSCCSYIYLIWYFLMDYAGKLSFSPKKSFIFVLGTNSEQEITQPSQTLCASTSKEWTPFYSLKKNLTVPHSAKQPRILPTARSGHLTSLKNSERLAPLLTLLCVVTWMFST